MSQYDLVGIGNALVDVLAKIEDRFLVDHELPKGAMILVEADRSKQLYDRLGTAVEVSGGSCGNTLAGFASLGGRGAYIGKVRNDQFGDVFRHDLRAMQVDFHTPSATDGPPTGRCLVMVSPDAQRTMCTYLGAANELTPEDVDPAVIQAAEVTYMEGYLFDRPAAKRAFFYAATQAHDAGRKVSLTLSDSFCVDRHRDEFLELIEHHIDILFANEAEITALYQVGTFDEALQRVRDHCEIACLTRSEKGSLILSGDEVHLIDAEPVERVVDTTGAGDLYASGFLFGYTQGADLATCGRIASISAAEIISHYGARPETSLKTLVQAAGVSV